jgi:hypothetical protein
VKSLNGEPVKGVTFDVVGCFQGRFCVESMR